MIAGAGPGGLTAAYELTKRGEHPVVLEADEVVGGISRTVLRDGWRFDLGGHRFFTKVDEVEKLWHEILPEGDFLIRPRMSRIFYEGKYYDYPLKATNTLRNLGLWEAMLCGFSYIWARVHPPKDEHELRGLVGGPLRLAPLPHLLQDVHREGVGGEGAADAVRLGGAAPIKNLDLRKAVINALLPRRKQTEITSLIEEFQYPKLGPGMMWEVCAEKVVAAGGTVHLSSPLTQIHVWEGRATSVTYVHHGAEVTLAARHVISTMPIARAGAHDRAGTAGRGAGRRRRAALSGLSDGGPHRARVPQLSGQLDLHPCPDVEVGRIQNYGSWSPYLVKDGRTCLGLEYFVFEGDAVWEMPDDHLITLATKELSMLGLVEPGDVEGGYVVRVPKAYPYYDFTYAANVETIRRYLAAEAPQYPPGRAERHA